MKDQVGAGELSGIEGKSKCAQTRKQGRTKEGVLQSNCAQPRRARALFHSGHSCGCVRLNPKPQTPNPKPQTLNPEPQQLPKP